MGAAQRREPLSKRRVREKGAHGEYIKKMFHQNHWLRK